ncbi:hypothetical protein D3C81_1236320 [compost metagenome]
MGLHGLDQHRPRRAAGERLDQRGGQGVDEAGVPAKPLGHPAQAVEHAFQCPGRTQHAYRAEHRHQVGQQVLGNIESFLGAVDEGFVDRHLLQPTQDQEQHDQAEQGQVAEQRG